MILEKIKQLARQHPFHNVKRLLNGQDIMYVKGGDCYQLAHTVVANLGGQVVTCRYKKSGDYHWVAKVDNQYIDLTDKKLIFGEEFLDKVDLLSGGLHIYHDKRVTALDNIFLLRMYVGDTPLEVKGDKVTYGNYVSIIDPLLKHFILRSLNIPIFVSEYLDKFFITSTNNNIE